MLISIPCSLLLLLNVQLYLSYPPGFLCLGAEMLILSVCGFALTKSESLREVVKRTIALCPSRTTTTPSEVLLGATRIRANIAQFMEFTAAADEVADERSLRDSQARLLALQIASY